VTDRHTAVDYAHVLKDLAEIHFPHKASLTAAPAPPTAKQVPRCRR